MAITQEVLDQLTAEDLDLIAGTEVGTTYLNSKLDSARSKAVETYKAGKGKELIDTEIEKAKATLRAELEAKYNPQKSPAELKIEELERKLLEREKAEAEKAMQLLITSEGTKAGIPAEILNFVAPTIISEDNDKTLENLTNFKVLWEKGITSGVDNRFKEKGKEPGGRVPGKTDDFKRAMKNGDRRSALRALMDESGK